MDIKLNEVKSMTISDFMVVVRGNQTMAAELLSVNRGTIRNWLEKDSDVLIIVNGFAYKAYTAAKRIGNYGANND